MPRGSRSLLCAAMACGLLAAPQAAGADGVAYLKGGEVWVSSFDGSTKVQLSAGEGGWNAVGQSTSGSVVATRRAPGAAAGTTTFTIWNGSGNVTDSGPASPGSFATGLAMPFSLDLAKTNKLVVSGFSNSVSGETANGYALLPSATRVVPAGSTFTGTAIRYPTLASERLLGTADGLTLSIQDGGGYSSRTFNPWITFSSVLGVAVRAGHASDDGKVVAVELATESPATERIAMVPAAGLGEAIQTGDCFLPATGLAPSADVSADGQTVAWADADGLKIGGRPDFGGADPCALVRPAQLIQVGASDPALGPLDVAKLSAARTKLATRRRALTPAPGAAPTIVLADPFRVSSLKRGRATVSVGAGRGGTASVVLSVKGRVLARGSGRLADAGAVTLGLRPTAAGRKARAGARATLKIAAGGTKRSATVKLR